MSFKDYRKGLEVAENDSTDSNSRQIENPNFTDMLGDEVDFGNSKKNNRKKVRTSTKSGKFGKLKETLNNRKEKKESKLSEQIARDQENMSEYDFHMKYSNRSLATKITLGIIVLGVLASIIFKMIN